MDKWSEDVKAIVDEFAEWMDSEGLSQKQAAQRLGVSNGTMSDMLRHKYVGDVARIAEEMLRILERAHMEDQVPEDPDPVRTSVTDRVQDLLRICHVEGVIGIVTGPTGIGKSVGAQFYRESEPQTLYVSVKRSSSAWTLLSKLAGELGVSWGGSTDEGVDRLAQELDGARRLVIVDEIDHADESILQELRMLHDAANRNFGMAWISTPAFIEKMVRRNSRTMDQVLGRIGPAVSLGKCSADDLGRILADVPMTDQARRALIDGACGQARRVVEALRSARRRTAGEVTVQHVRAAYREKMATLEQLRNGR